MDKQSNKQYCIVYITCPQGNDYSQNIVQQLLENKLAACVNIVEQVTSCYTWNNKIETSQEQLLIVKTSTQLFEAVKNKVLALHPYQCPEIIAVPIIAGNNAYIGWLNSCLLSQL